MAKALSQNIHDRLLGKKIERKLAMRIGRMIVDHSTYSSCILGEIS